MKKFLVSITEGEYNELSKIAKENRRTIGNEVAFLIHASIPNLSHQRRAHDTDTEPSLTISETLELAKLDE